MLTPLNTPPKRCDYDKFLQCGYNDQPAPLPIFLYPRIYRLVSWERDQESKKIVDYVKGLFASLLLLPVRLMKPQIYRHYMSIYQREVKIKECQRRERINRQAREKIVAALGGPGRCEKIPVVPVSGPYFDEANLAEHFNFENYALGRGDDAIVQGEDPAGRRFVGLRLKEVNGYRNVWCTIFQRYVEKFVDAENHLQGKTDEWRVNIVARDHWGIAASFNLKLQRECYCTRAEEIAEFLKTILAGRHPKLKLYTPL